MNPASRIRRAPPVRPPRPGIGRRDYLFGEQTDLVPSLVARSVLAWQISGGSLAG